MKSSVPPGARPPLAKFRARPCEVGSAGLKEDLQVLRVEPNDRSRIVSGLVYGSGGEIEFGGMTLVMIRSFTVVARLLTSS